MPRKVTKQNLFSTSKNKQITVIVGLVIRKGKILMVRRFEPEVKGAHLKWEFPGGKVDFGESIEEAIIREIYEETGVRVKVKRLLPITVTVYWDYPWGIQQTLLFGFECDYLSEEKRKNDHHVKEVEWIPVIRVSERESLPGGKEFLDCLLNT